MLLGVKASIFETADIKFVPVYEYLRFVDLYKLFSGSLEKLVETLPDWEFAIMASLFADILHSRNHLFKQKGYYLYS